MPILADDNEAMVLVAWDLDRPFRVALESCGKNLKTRRTAHLVNTRTQAMMTSKVLMMKTIAKNILALVVVRRLLFGRHRHIPDDDDNEAT